MTLKKIRVQDSNQNFHVFKGQDLQWTREQSVYDIFHFEQLEDGDFRRVVHGSFTLPISIKYISLEDKKPASPPVIQEEVESQAPPPEYHDEFTERDLAQRDIQAPYVESLFPERDSLHNQEVILTEDLGNLKAGRYKAINPALQEAMQGEEESNAAPVPPETEQAIQDASMDEKPEDDVPELSEEEKKDEFEKLKTGYGEDVTSVLEQAEQKHKARVKPSCDTCEGAGTVPDEESDDPLDTKICPDC